VKTPPLAARHFDGRSAQGRPVWLRLDDGGLVALPSADAAGAESGDALRHRPSAAVHRPSAAVHWPAADLHWPERTRHGQRVIHLRQGGSLVVEDAAAFDAWRAAHGHHDGWLVRAQQHWRGTALAVLLLVAALAGAYRWGVPLAAQGVLLAVPAQADARVGDLALDNLRRRGLLQPSTVPAPRREALARDFSAMVAAGHGAGQAPAYTLHFQASEELGPNALALPGGHIVVTDALVGLLAGHDATLLGVMAHELGHVQARHGMRSLVQLSLLTVGSQLLLGDVSSLLAGVPALLGQLGYSRDFERQADGEALRLLRASGHDPAVMVLLFEKLRARDVGKRGGQNGGRDTASGGLGIALASHPADAERIAFFRDAGR
jgi:Zn-dependent protease with chaperone function